MKTRMVVVLGLIGATVLIGSWLVDTRAASSQSGVVAFGPKPAFAADGEANARLTDIGPAAYIESGQAIDLDDVSSVYETIEDQTADYIIGSVSLPDYGNEQDETFHVHAYIDTDGWLLVYFMDDTPAAKLIDWKAYINSSGTNITTLLEAALIKVASAADVAYEPPTFYHFDHPNATHMMFIADLTEPRDYDQFRVELPSGYTYYETSWGLYRNVGCCTTSFWQLDGTAVSGSNLPSNTIGWGTVSLSPNQEHLIEINHTGGLVIVYREG